MILTDISTEQAKDDAAGLAVLILERVALTEQIAEKVCALGRIEDELERRGVLVERITQAQGTKG